MTNSPADTPDWFGWANACISELVPVAALLEIRRRRRAAKPAGYPLTLLVAAAGLSLSAQFAVAKPGVSGALLSAVPALAFMALVKLIFSATPSRVADVATSPARVAQVDDVTPSRVAQVAKVTPAAAVAAERREQLAALSPAAAVAAARPSPVRVVAQVDDVTPPPRDKATPRPSRQSSADAIRDAATKPGATPASVAAALGVSVRTAQRHWPRPTVATPTLVAVTA